MKYILLFLSLLLSRPVQADSLVDASCSGIVLDPIAINQAGWVQLPSSSRMIFVSKANAGMTNDPNGILFKVETIQQGAKLLRRGMPDSLLLARGETFEGGDGIPAGMLGGRSSADLMVIGAFGSGARPKILFRGAFGLLNATAPISNLLIHSLHLLAVRTDNAPEGIRYVAKGGKNFILEDMRIEGFQSNLDFDTQEPGLQNLLVRRSMILDAYDNGVGHSQGMYMDRVKGAVIEENVFDHNGWQNRVGGKGVATIFNHNLYLQTDNKCVTFRKNVSMRASATGLQMRMGGVMEDNFFYLNPLHLTYGAVDGGSVQLKHLPMGVSGRISRNVFLKGADINPTNLRTGSIQIANILKLTMDQNIVAHHIRGAAAGTGYNLKSNGSGLGIHNVLFQNNIAYDLGQKFLVQGDVFGTVTVKSDGNGGANVWMNNKIAISANQSGIASPASPQTLKDDGTLVSSNVFQKGETDFLAQPNLGIPSIILQFWQKKAMVYKDPMRGIETYQNIGGEAAFISHLRDQSFDESFDAITINEYIRQGFKP